MNFKHGFGSNGNRTYRIWCKMRQRCENANNPAYARYGGRGIKVCERWQIFANFIADMGDAPEGLSIDRYPNNDGDYEPSNCRWATAREQALNRRPFTEQTKMKMSAAKLGERKSEHHRHKLSLALMGHAVSAETRKKISDSRRKHASQRPSV